jgi:pyridinium-3,5-biscarboxylic acid mononucleotide sulfurtransferase
MVQQTLDHPYEATMNRKTKKLLSWFTDHPRVAVACSGGVDSSLLAELAHQAQGADALILTLDSVVSPVDEVYGARALAMARGWNHRVIAVDWLGVPGLNDNPPDRCYHCKLSLFGRILEEARTFGAEAVVDGTNVDDAGDHRPGRRALEELEVRSPFVELGWGKADIRAASRDLSLPTAEHPPAACLATRFPHGARLSPPLLARVGRAEVALRGMGFVMVRVRDHGELARVELAADALGEATARAGEIVNALQGLGYRHVTLDLAGYRVGSFNVRPTEGP